MHRTAQRVMATVIITVMMLTASGPAIGGGFSKFADKAENVVKNAESIIGSIGLILQAFSKVSDEVNKVGRQMDPKFKPEYVRMRQRNIERKQKEYREAKQRYDDSGWWEFLDKGDRKKEMEDAEKKWMEDRAKWEREQYQFKKKLSDEAENNLFFRKSDRKKQAIEQLRRYGETVLEYERKKMKQMKYEYEDTWGIRFLKKRELKKKYEEQKEIYENKLAAYEAELIKNSQDTPWDYFAPNKLRQMSDQTGNINDRVKSWENGYKKNRTAIISSQGGAAGGIAAGQAAGPGIPILSELIALFGAFTGQESGHGVDRRLYRRRQFVERSQSQGADYQPPKAYEGHRIELDTSNDM